MSADLLTLREEALASIQAVQALDELEQVRVHLLGRKGRVTQLIRSIGKLPSKERRDSGRLANELKGEVAQALKRRHATLTTVRSRLDLDTSLPGHAGVVGRSHPITQTIRELEEIFRTLGFETVEGPEVEDERHNFEALNIPADHPSREAFDTLYLADGTHLLRSQTSTVQIRIMEERQPPLFVVAPGRVYRPDAVDASHSWMFHQVEGLAVDRGLTFGDLKGTLDTFLKQWFGPKTKTRFRPHYFPFTEPSAEVDVSCICDGRGCSVCGQRGWVEVLGCGLLHPAVFEAVDYDPTVWSGFAFGLGVERLAMLRHGISDIRLFYENDFRFLEQF